MRTFRNVAALATVLLLSSSAGAEFYSAEDCAEVAGTLNMHWRAVDGPNAPCATTVTTDGTFADASDGSVSLTGTGSSDESCMGLDHYSLFLSADHLALTGYDTTNDIPIFFGLSSDGKCYFGQWLKGDQDYTVHISVDAFESAAPPVCGDMNSSESVNTSDALLVLKKGVGQDVTLNCDANENLATCTAQLTMCINQLTDARAFIHESEQNECGDGSINVPGEHCDLEDLGDFTCAALIPGSHGTLGCDQHCHFDTSKCSPCEGAVVGGLCWFQGDWGKSCTEVCQAEGLVYDEKTNQYIPENISGATRCADVAAALPLPPDPTDCGFYYNALWGGGPSYADHCGCVADRDDCLDNNSDITRSFLDVTGTTTADAKNNSVARICACR